MRPNPITVAELNNYIKSLVDESEFLNNVYIKGEISNLKNHYSGHIYFTLKDQTSLIKCVMFKSYTGNLNFAPKDGDSVLILGTVSVFERDGVYQIYVKGMEQDGVGNLYAAYEKLKSKLEDEGLFDTSHKKKIPMLPKTIGVATSRTGAVIRDIINVTTRRLPNVNIILYPTAVQGKGAANEIASAIEYFNNEKKVDVIIIGRGGGSLEDLWPFNEEILARAIYNSEVPIISAVGHETDFTIADFVADLRAPTPSAAGELAVPDINEVNWKIKMMKDRLSLSLKKKIENAKNRYKHVTENRIYKEPYDNIRKNILMIDSTTKQLVSNISMNMKNLKMKLVKTETMLDSLSPLKTLTRGYSIVENKEGKVIKTIKDVTCNDEINIIFFDGKKQAKIL